MSTGKKVNNLGDKIVVSQVQVTDYLMVDHSFISEVESGSRTLNVVMPTKFAHLAGIEPNIFLMIQMIWRVLRFNSI